LILFIHNFIFGLGLGLDLKEIGFGLALDLKALASISVWASGPSMLQ